MASLRNVHPGDVLNEEFLQPMGVSQNALARAMGVPPRVLTRSCWASVQSPPTPPCDSHALLERRQNSG